MDGSDEQEILITAQGGMMFIIVGQIEAAREVGEWMKRLWDLQPDVEHWLHPIYNHSEDLVTDHTPDRELFYAVKKLDIEVNICEDPDQDYLEGKRFLEAILKELE